MDIGFSHYWKILQKHKGSCLNPYSNGYWFFSIIELQRLELEKGLNPYSNGYWFFSEVLFERKRKAISVLILILMDIGFSPETGEIIGYYTES